MKQSDIFTLILIAGIGTLAAFFVCQTLLGDPSEAKVEYKTIRNTISSDLTMPEPEIFNSTAINPTIEVYVGDCEDQNHNGILEQEELEACEKAQQGNNKDDKEDQENNEKVCDENDENCVETPPEGE